MKKLFTLAFATVLSYTAFAQVQVVNADSVRLGNPLGTGGIGLYGKIFLKNLAAAGTADSILTVAPNGHIRFVPRSELVVNVDLSAYQTLANLSSDLTASATKYPSVNAVNAGLALKANDADVIKTTGDQTGLSGNKSTTGTVEIQKNGIGNMPTDGLILTNTTGGSTQYSPAIIFKGNFLALGAESRQFRLYQNNTGATPRLNLDLSTNTGSSFTTALQFMSNRIIFGSTNSVGLDGGTGTSNRTLTLPDIANGTIPAFSTTPASGALVKWSGTAGLLVDAVAGTDYLTSSDLTTLVSDDAYGSGWNAVTDVAPSKNAVYDKIESMSGTFLPYTGATSALDLGSQNIITNGKVNVGTGGISGFISILNTKDFTGGGISSYYGNRTVATVKSDITVSAYGYDSALGTESVNFNLLNIYHFNTSQNPFLNKDMGGSVTNQVGFRATQNLIGATNNYGFRGEIEAGTGRWNLYMSGTAPNYLNGNLGIGTTPGTTERLTIGGATLAYGDIELYSSSDGLILKSPDGTRWRITVSNAGVLTANSL